MRKKHIGVSQTIFALFGGVSLKNKSNPQNAHLYYKIKVYMHMYVCICVDESTKKKIKITCFQYLAMIIVNMHVLNLWGTMH